jgi:hypothetical protein
MSNDKRLTRVTVRLTHVEKSRWKETARREGLDLSSFIRRMMSIRTGAGPKRVFIRADDSGPPSSGGTP